MKRETRTLLLTSLLSTLAACGSGGSGAPAAGGGLDQGAYSVEAFDWHDPRPASFHPLGTESRTLEPLDELVLVSGQYGSGSATGRVLDDALAGTGVVADTGGLFGAGGTLIGTAAGNVDDDAAAELVALSRQGSAGTVSVRVAERGSNGAYAVVSTFTAPYRGSASLALGDVDGDHRDEILVATADSVQVFDDASAGFLLVEEVSGGMSSSTFVRTLAVDLDQDGRDEIAMVGLRSDFLYVRLLDDGASEPAPFAELQPWKIIESGFLSGLTEGRLLGGDFDGDGREELAIAWTRRSPGGNSDELHLEGYELRDGVLERTSQYVDLFPDLSGFGQLVESWDAVALNRTGAGPDEVAVILPDADFFDLRFDVDVLTRSGSSWSVSTTRTVAGVWDYGLPGLCAADVDADGAQELWIGVVELGRPSLFRMDWTPAYSQQPVALPAITGLVGHPWLVAGDFDADGLVLESTGRRQTTLSDPMPLVVLAAAPTQAGIAQNREATRTSYTSGTTSTQSIGVASETTYSAGAGYDFLVGKARVEVSRALRTSEVESHHLTFVQGFHASYDDDVIVFQGTLYRSYEYEVVHAADPALVGTLLTLDVPVDSNVYKWTVSHYNDTFGPDRAIGTDVLPHRIGDPASYPTLADVDALVDAHVGWRTPDSIPVGLGSSTIDLGIKLADESATTTERTFGVSTELEFSLDFLLAGSSGSLSYGIADTDIYTVTVTDFTEYTGEVGDIRASDYDAWQYEFGLAVYHHGVLADDENEPIGHEEGELPYQVVTFWTVPTGSAY